MLVFNLKKEWFKKIKSGEKTHEYREIKPYWTNRIMKSLYGDYINNDAYFLSMCAGGHGFAKPLCDEIIFCNGYPKSDDKSKRLKAIVKKITTVNGLNTDLKINKSVFDIEFELIKEKGAYKNE